MYLVDLCTCMSGFDLYFVDLYTCIILHIHKDICIHILILIGSNGGFDLDGWKWGEVGGYEWLVLGGVVLELLSFFSFKVAI